VGEHVLPGDVAQEEHSNHMKNSMPFSEREPVNHFKNNICSNNNTQDKQGSHKKPKNQKKQESRKERKGVKKIKNKATSNNHS
jgi:hypothetical protein